MFSRTLYLVQHGKAVSKDIDPERPLSDLGRQETQLIANLAAKLNLGVQSIGHSGKKRAEQTATIFGETLSISENVMAISGLNPTDDVKQMTDALANEERLIMLVGHLPFMARLAGLLVNGDPESSPVEFHNSGIVCLEYRSDRWQVSWYLMPG